VVGLRAPLEVTRTRMGTSLWPVWPPALRGEGGGRLRPRTVHQDQITRLMGGALLAARIGPSVPIKTWIRMVMTARVER